MSKESDLLKIVTDRTKKDGLSKVENKDLLERISMGYAALYALQNSCNAVRLLGEDGKKVVEAGGDFVNDHVEADSASEVAMRNEIDKWGKVVGYRALIWGEELGKNVSVGNITSEKVSRWFIDGLDGTANYRKPENWSYGPMIAGARKENPTYDDFEVAGIGLPEENAAILGIKEIGVFFINFEDENIKILEPFENEEEFNMDLILADNYYNEVKAILGDDLPKIWSRTGSTAASIAAIVLGKTYKNEKFPEMSKGSQALVEATGKDNLEIACFYLLMDMMGGIVCDMDGNSIGDKKFIEWSQRDENGKDIHTPIVIAKNERILNRIFDLLNH